MDKELQLFILQEIIKSLNLDFIIHNKRHDIITATINLKPYILDKRLYRIDITLKYKTVIEMNHLYIRTKIYTFKDPRLIEQIKDYIRECYDSMEHHNKLVKSLVQSYHKL